MMEYLNVKAGDERLKIEYHHYFGDIIPEFVIEDNVPKHIVCLNPIYILKGLRMRTANKRIMEVHAYGIHPNCDINTGKLCLKDNEQGVKVTDIDAFKNILVNRLKVYYYDDCHFRLDHNDCQTEPVDGFTKIDVNFTKGEIHECKPPFRRLYPKED
jgi:hypothetical protein